MLSDRCLSVLSVCDVGVLWPNGWMDQDETWHADSLGPGHTVLDGDHAPPPPKGHSPRFLAHIGCGQMAGWIKMTLGMEAGLSQGDFVLDGDPTPLPKKGVEPPLQFSAHVHCGWMDQDGPWHRGGPWSRPYCAR